MKNYFKSVLDSKGNKIKIDAKSYKIIRNLYVLSVFGLLVSMVPLSLIVYVKEPKINLFVFIGIVLVSAIMQFLSQYIKYKAIKASLSK